MLRPTYPIHTARLRLRPYTLADLDALYAIQSRADVVRYLSGELRSQAEVHTVVESRARPLTLEQEGDRLFLAIERRDSGVVMGDVSLHWLSLPFNQQQGIG
jgi:RimJ/RimL family protein N-acetyltransferase